MNDRAAFRTAAAICVLLCLIWDVATVVLFVVLPLQLAAIGLLYWGADGLFGPGSAGSGPRPGRADPGQRPGVPRSADGRSADGRSADGRSADRTAESAIPAITAVPRMTSPASWVSG